MTTNVTDSHLFRLLRGQLSESEQAELEEAIEVDTQLRERWEQLSDAHEWPVGSAPQPKQITSVHLSGVMASLVAAAGDDAEIKKPSSKRIDVPEIVYSGGVSGIRIVREIGRGGMGIVYEGFDDLLQRRVAVKQLLQHQPDNVVMTERLLREAQAIAQLRHENILGVYGVSVVDGTPVLIQQYVDGQSLEQRLQQQPPLMLEQCVDYARQIAKGLAAAHVAGVIHRDLKPANILLHQDTNQLLIADFGLAKRSQAELTSTQTIAGTPAYMSPEQSRGQTINHRSDLFSLGTLIYRMLTGKLPFDHEDSYVVLEMIRETQVPSARAIQPEVPEWLSYCIERLMAKSPEDRLQSAQEVIDILDRQVVVAVSAQAYPSAKASAFTRWVGLAGLCLLFVAGLWFFYYLKPLETKRESVSGVPPVSLNGSQPALSLPNPDLASGRQGVWIEGSTQQQSDLAEAVAQADDGATIRVAGDCQASRIVIHGKRLTIAAAEGTRPRITCRDPEEGGPASFLIRTHSDLTLRGLTVEWRPRDDVPLYADGIVSSVIFSTVGTYLQIDDCELASEQTGAVVGVGGHATLRNCSLSGGNFAFGWVAYENRTALNQCILRSDIGVGIIFPPVGVVAKPDAGLEFADTTFFARTAVDLALMRNPERGFEIVAANCRFDGTSVITLTGLAPRAPALDTEAKIREAAKQLVHWRESNCEFSQTSNFLDARTFRTLKRWRTAGIDSQTEWQEFWDIHQ